MHLETAGGNDRPTNIRPSKDLARKYAATGEWTVALECWTLLLKETPGDIACYLGLSVCFRYLKRLDEAHDILSKAAAAFGEHRDVAIEFARVSNDKRDFASAAQQYKRLTEAYPDSPPGWIGAAASFRELGRLVEAGEFAAFAAEKFPGEPGGLIELAKIAQASSDLEEAAIRWAKVRQRFPNFSAAYTAGAWQLRRLLKFRDAEALLEAAMDRFPDYAQAPMDHARIAQSEEKWAVAADRWRSINQKFPDHPDGFAGLALAYENTGAIDEAEALLSRALERFPTDESCLVQFARLAAARQDWRQAVERWAQAIKYHPNSDRVRHGYGKTRILAALELAVDSAESDEVATSSIAGEKHPSAASSGNDFVAVDPPSLLSRFESLGGNCEFGLVQRHYGIEPLGLLRWTGVPPDLVTSAIRARFEGVGLPENTTLEPMGGEWVSGDKRWRLIMHTFIQEGHAKHEQLYPKICRRLKFLSAKIIEDLQESEKIFIYQHPLGISSLEIDNLFDAVRSIGPVTLLCVQLETKDHPAGSVEWVKDNLLIGYIDKLGPEEVPGLPANWNKFSYRLWLDICKKAADLVDHRKAVEFSEVQAKAGKSLEGLMGLFEGLGSGCEFGLVQRHYGCEPLGLLRWSSITPHQLIDLLHADFEGVGEPGNTTLSVTEGENEIYCSDSRFGMRMHTFVQSSGVDIKKFKAKQCTRLRFLANKLREDLRLGEKIFVYKPPMGTMPDAEVLQVHDCIRKYGPGLLLCIRLADDANPSCSIRFLRDGVAVGYLQSLSYQACEEEIAFEPWLKLLLRIVSVSGERDL